MEVKMLKKCTRLWREGHLEVNIAKTHAMFGPLLGAQKRRTQLWCEACLQLKSVEKEKEKERERDIEG